MAIAAPHRRQREASRLVRSWRCSIHDVGLRRRGGRDPVTGASLHEELEARVEINMQELVKAVREDVLDEASKKRGRVDAGGLAGVRSMVTAPVAASRLPPFGAMPFI